MGRKEYSGYARVLQKSAWAVSMGLVRWDLGATYI